MTYARISNSDRSAWLGAACRYIGRWRQVGPFRAGQSLGFKFVLAAKWRRVDHGIGCVEFKRADLGTGARPLVGAWRGVQPGGGRRLELLLGRVSGLQHQCLKVMHSARRQPHTSTIDPELNWPLHAIRNIARRLPVACLFARRHKGTAAWCSNTTAVSPQQRTPRQFNGPFSFPASSAQSNPIRKKSLK